MKSDGIFLNRLNAPRNGTRRVPPSGAKIPVEVKPGESAPKPPPKPVEVKEEPAETARSSGWLATGSFVREV